MDTRDRKGYRSRRRKKLLYYNVHKCGSPHIENHQRPQLTNLTQLTRAHANKNQQRKGTASTRAHRQFCLALLHEVPLPGLALEVAHRVVVVIVNHCFSALLGGGSSGQRGPGAVPVGQAAHVRRCGRNAVEHIGHAIVHLWGVNSKIVVRVRRGEFVK